MPSRFSASLQAFFADIFTFFSSLRITADGDILYRLFRHIFSHIYAER
jgi:hypothetical protein